MTWEISLQVHEILRETGHDSLHLREEGLQGMADARIVEKARQEKRIVLTHDLDFGRLLALSGEATPSVITFRLSDMRPQSVLEGRHGCRPSTGVPLRAVQPR